MQALLIVVLGVVAAILYGIVHDEITIRLCLEYFTVFHPFLIETQSPTVLAAAWGVAATWWVGLPIGVSLAASARIGEACKMSAWQLIPRVGILLLMMAGCALFAGIAGYLYGPIPGFITSEIPPANYHRFVADWWAHNASYLSGGMGGLVLCVFVIHHRRTEAKSLADRMLK